jgi:hypothetical protein
VPHSNAAKQRCGPTPMDDEAFYRLSSVETIWEQLIGKAFRPLRSLSTMPLLQPSSTTLADC